MALKINDDRVTSDQTRHYATAWPVPDEETLWTATHLPGRNLTRSQAVTAMRIAEEAARGVKPGDRIWPHVEGWAAEIGLTADDAVALALMPLEEDGSDEKEERGG